MPTLLLLSGGCRVGQNVLATLTGRRDGLRLVATSSVADEPALFDFDAVHLVPPTADDARAFESRLLAILDAERIDLVVPCRDDDVVFLAALSDRRPELASRLLCGGGTIAETLTDKALAYRFCAERGLPFVESLIDPAHDERRRFVDQGGLPAVAKPRRGFSSRGIRIVWTVAQLERALARGDVLQRFIGDAGAVERFRAAMEEDGLPLHHTFQTLKHSIQVLVGPSGGIEHVVCTRNRLDLRRAKRIEPDTDEASRELGVRSGSAFAAEGWRGPLNIQCQRDADGLLRIHEFNGRFTGATAARWRLGFDEVGAAIERFAGTWPGASIRPPAAHRAWEDLAVRAADPRDIEALQRDGHWRAH